MQKAPSPELWGRWGTFGGTVVNVREVVMNMVLWVRQSSPNFARLRQSLNEDALMLPIYAGICLKKGMAKILLHFVANCGTNVGNIL